MKLISWNMAHREEAWRYLLSADADVALVQEAAEPPPEVACQIEAGVGPWNTPGADGSRPWRTAVVRLSDSVQLEWLGTASLQEATMEELAVSRSGTLAAAVVTARDGQRLTAVSMYGLWERPHPRTESSWIYADASVHRLISDLAALVGHQHGHQILAAGDLNILYGYGEGGSKYWGARYETVFQRMESMGIPFVGPQAPDGRRAEPWPSELPPASRNVPTYHNAGVSPAEATRQIDYVFASRSLAERTRVRALNVPEAWGPSDHCQLEILIE